MTAFLFEDVLLVEDDPGHALLIKRGLKAHCASVTHVICVKDARALLLEKTFGLIVTDMNLPDASGVNGVNQVVAMSEGAPVIVLTSSTLLNEAIGAMKSGAKDYIVKNFEGNFSEIMALSLSRVHAAVMLQQERNRLQRELKVLREAIDNSSDGLAVVNSNGTIQYCNPSLRQLINRCGGDNLENVFSLASENVVSADEFKLRLEENFSSLSEGATWRTEFTLKESDTAVYECSIAAMTTALEATVNRYVIWIKDRSELRSKEKFQREIISTTTHDLKGPLGAIMLSADLLTSLTERGEKPYEIALRVANSARGALDIIDEFLSARRLQEGTLVLKPQAYGAESLIEQVIDDYTAAAAARKVDISVEVPDGLTINVDRLGFLRVLSNLISNAIKFSTSGGPVSISAAEKENYVAVTVKDQGTGMDPAQIQKAFDRFSRLEQHSIIQGTGLGLYVVKSIVDAHGGRIDVTSQPEKGTAFTIFFPVAPPVDERGELISLAFR